MVTLWVVDSCMSLLWKVIFKSILYTKTVDKHHNQTGIIPVKTLVKLQHVKDTGLK
jgi:hypothetical protein